MINGFPMRFMQKAAIMLFMLLVVSGAGAQQKIRVEGGVKQGVQKSDSLIRPTLDSTITKKAQELGVSRDSALVVMRDSLLTTSDSSFMHGRDSLLLAELDSLNIDPAFIGSSQRLSDSLASGGKTLAVDTAKLAKQKLRFTQDTIKAGRLTLLSLAPGVGQIYNRQPWKLPVVYGTIGGFVTAGIMFNKTYKDHRIAYDRAVNLNLPPEMVSLAKKRMQRAGGARTMMYSMAAVSYLYQVADATFNYRGVNDPIRKATTLAAVFPGMGFVYTKTYWRLPIYYGGFIALATMIDYNNRSFMRYRKAYTALTDSDPTTKDEFNGRYSPEVILNVRNAYRRDRDFAILAMAAAYLISIVDTHVIASLKNWEVDENLSIKIEPTIIDNRIHRASTVPNGYGLAVKIRF